MPLPKPCRDCNTIFQPKGKFCYYCDKCLIKRGKDKDEKAKKINSRRLKTPKNTIPAQTTNSKDLRAKRCKECGKILRDHNQSLLCATHWNIKRCKERRLTRRVIKLETIEMNMKKEEVQYLIDIKKKNGTSDKQIIKELERDMAFQEKLKKLKKVKKKAKEKSLQESKETNKRFKEEFAKLK